MVLFGVRSTSPGLQAISKYLTFCRAYSRSSLLALRLHSTALCGKSSLNCSLEPRSPRSLVQNNSGCFTKMKTALFYTLQRGKNTHFHGNNLPFPFNSHNYGNNRVQMLLFIWVPAFEFLKLAAGTFSKGVNRAELLRLWRGGTAGFFLVFWGKWILSKFVLQYIRESRATLLCTRNKNRCWHTLAIKLFLHMRCTLTLL